jgi:hypothetical protein
MQGAALPPRPNRPGFRAEYLMKPKYRVVPMIASGALLACACAWAWAAGTALAASTAAPAAAATAPVPKMRPASGAPPATAPDAAPTAGADAPPADFKTLDQEVQGLKKDVIDLNKDLFVLEEELLFPANTQVALYVSMDVGTFFALDSVTVKIDNKEVKNYLYTAREADALLKGGVQQIYLGNLKVGKHELVAFFTGKGPAERDYKRGATINFDKGVGAKYLELKITDRVAKHQPEFAIKDWE